MRTSTKKREIARVLFVSGKSIQETASILGVGVRTIQNYKSKDATEQNDWDMLKAERHITKDSNRREHLYSDFVAYMYDTLKEIREDKDLSSSDKADKIVKLSDAFSKMKTIARHEDPEAYKRGIIKHVIKTIGIAIKSKDKALLEAFIEVVDSVQDELDVSL